MSDSLPLQVADAFAGVTEDDRKAFRALDDFESDRIQSRRRYEEFVDLPLSPGPITSG